MFPILKIWLKTKAETVGDFQQVELVQANGQIVTFVASQLSEKDRLLETLEQETEKARAVREMEERLISSAFYNLSMQMHRSTVEARLSNVHSTSSPHGQSFLARQRQVQNAVPTQGSRNATSTTFTNAN